MKPSNEDIARWMGEPKHPQADTPRYDTDPAAALRVLARMSESREVELMYSSDSKLWICTLERIDHHSYWQDYTAPTPSAAIVAAWAAEFGGGHE